MYARTSACVAASSTSSGSRSPFVCNAGVRFTACNIIDDCRAERNSAEEPPPERNNEDDEFALELQLELEFSGFDSAAVEVKPEPDENCIASSPRSSTGTDGITLDVRCSTPSIRIHAAPFRPLLCAATSCLNLSAVIGYFPGSRWNGFAGTRFAAAK